MNTIHPAIQEEFNMLRTRYPNKIEMSLDDYADYFRIGRHYACQHFRRLNEGNAKIAHKKIG